jgi:hypothetical protein
MIVETIAMMRRNMRMIARMKLSPHHHKVQFSILVPLIMMTGKMRMMVWKKRNSLVLHQSQQRRQDALDEVVE